MDVYNELSYENFHKNKDRIYRAAVGFGSGGSSMTLAGAMPALGPAAVESFPELESYTRFYAAYNSVFDIDSAKSFRQEDVYFTDSTVFKVFTFPLLRGNPATALLAPNSIVLSESTAEKFFGKTDPMGRTIKFNGKTLLTVTGIMEDVPENTQIRAKAFISYSTHEALRGEIPVWNSFGSDYTYFLANENLNPVEFEKKLSGLLAKNTNENFAEMMTFNIQPFSEIYLKSKLMGELQPQGNLDYIYLFSIISGLVLIISCMNFMNLSTVRSLKRAREVGLRKTLGASRADLVKQFLGESISITLISVLLSFLLFELFNPYLTEFLGKNISGSAFADYHFYLIVLGLIVFVGIAAGLYPAFFLSKFQPVESIKGNFKSSRSGILTRKALVFLQNSITIFLIAGTIIIYKQLNFMRDTDLGFDKNHVLILKYSPNSVDASAKYEVLRSELEKLSAVKAVSGAYTVPGTNNKEQQSIKRPGETEFKMVQANGVDYGYLQTLGISLKSGRNFSEERSTDARQSIIINETAQKLLNLTNPVGERVSIPSGDSDGSRDVTIIGVCEDFHLFSFRDVIEPMFLYINPERYYSVAVKFAADDPLNAIKQIKSVWEKVFPDEQLEYDFLENQYDALYESEEKTVDLFTVFSILAIVIAALGLFGLSSFSTEQRRKEIGVRRVLGAETSELMIQFAGEYVKWVLAANILAYPAIYFALNEWLSNFAYRIDVDLLSLIISSLIALLIAAGTVSAQTFKAASEKPVDSLRYE